MARFPRSEFAARYEKTRDAMERARIDGLMLSGDDHILYYTGMKSIFPWFTYTRPFVFILPVHEEPTLIIHGRYEGWIESDFPVDDVRSYHTKEGITPVTLIEEALKDKKLAGERIGSEIGNDQRIGMPVKDYIGLTNLLPKSEFVDASALLQKLRIVKSPAEAAYIEKAAQILNHAYEAFFQERFEGRTEEKQPPYYPHISEGKAQTGLDSSP